MNDFAIMATIGLVLIALLSSYLGSIVVRQRRTPLDLRPLPGYAVLPRLLDASVESDRPAHISLGAASIGDQGTGAALAAAEITYYLTRRLSFERRLPLITTSDPLTLLVATDTLRRAYIARDNLDAFRPNAIAWYPQGERSLAFAAGVSSLAASEQSTAHLLLGTYGAELALIGESAARHRQQMVANSTLLEGQAVAYAMADETLIGEELFVGSAYLDRDNVLHMSTLIAQDTLRWVVIAGILIAILVNLVTT
ncbi:MAG: DUF6754 domain-containing protein [Anaerolineales bacterium]